MDSKGEQDCRVMKEIKGNSTLKSELNNFLLPLFSIAIQLNTSQSFLFEYKTAVGSSISVMKKVKKKLLSDSVVVDTFSRKKHKSGLLKKSVKVIRISASGVFDGLAESISKNTTKSKSVDMEEKYLIEETSFQQESKGESGDDNTEIMPKGLKRVVTKHTFGKFLGTIDFSMKNDDNNNVLDGLFSFFLSLKHVVQILVRKFFALNIDLVVVAGNFSQKKLAYVKKIFSNVNSFERASTPLKFGGIIWAFFTSEKTMMAAAKLANNYDVVINTNLKFDQDAAGQMARADVNKQTWNSKDKFRALLYTFSMSMTAHDIWKFIGLVGEKTCIIDHNPITYACTHCTTVCFGSKSDLNSALDITPIIKEVGLHWSCLLLTLCSVLVKTPLTNVFHSNKPHFGSINDSKLFSPIVNELELQLINIESSLTNLVGQISELAKSNIVMRVDLDEITSGKTAAVLNLSLSSHVVKLENMLENLFASILSLSTQFDSLVLAGDVYSQLFSQ
ncbi:hypothetical protein G9A89_004262 [Geosiphon pyriformis]|nr:hypothetical protein G9A89_004262 [Geosiphon pyriformis]